MPTPIKLTSKDKFLDQSTFFVLLDDFIKDSYDGKRTKKNGKRISAGTIKNYTYLQKHLLGYSENLTFQIKLYIEPHIPYSQKLKVKHYWQKFYQTFTDYLYKLGYYDNYVGLIIKCLRSFFNYLRDERHIDAGLHYRQFFVPVENIPIIALNQTHLSYIINNKKFNKQIKNKGLEEIRDIFVFGCTVALRVSDLLALTSKNLVIQNDKYYLNVKSKKTNSYTSVKLPEYAVAIILKYENMFPTLLPTISIFWLNKKLKIMANMIPNNFQLIKTRERRGEQVIIYKDEKTKTHYQLSDHITTHTMRRTAITNMLCLGMPEHLTRKISGHAANSKEFFRYVELSQSFIDQETDKVFNQLVR